MLNLLESYFFNCFCLVVFFFFFRQINTFKSKYKDQTFFFLRILRMGRRGVRETERGEGESLPNMGNGYMGCADGWAVSKM